MLALLTFKDFRAEGLLVASKKDVREDVHDEGFHSIIRIGCCQGKMKQELKSTGFKCWVTEKVKCNTEEVTMHEEKDGVWE